MGHTNYLAFCVINFEHERFYSTGTGFKLKFSGDPVISILWKLFAVEAIKWNIGQPRAEAIKQLKASLHVRQKECDFALMCVFKFEFICET